MKRLFGLALLVLSLSVIPAQANLITFGNQCGQMPVGPWYLYWPLEAHFQTPASPQYPYWSAPMTLPFPAGQGMGGYNPYGQMQGQGMGGYNPYGNYGGYGAYQTGPAQPIGGAPR